MDLEILRDNLKTVQWGREITYLAATESTNDELWELVMEGAAGEGHVVVTDQQTSGRGRRGRSWFSGSGLGLTFSILVKPRTGADYLGLITLGTGVAVVDALRGYEVTATLKWPNDILYSGKKLGGILAESKRLRGDLFVVIGVGLNINERAEDFPAALRPQSISTKLILGHVLPREQVLAAILRANESHYSGTGAQVRERWMSYCGHLRRNVTVHLGHDDLTGTFSGIDPRGRAMIQVGGNKVHVSAGELET